MDAKQLQQVEATFRSQWPNGPAQHFHALVDGSPRGVYDFIQKYFPGEFQKLTPGLEKGDFYKNRLKNFLIEKHTRAVKQGKGLDFEIFVSQNTYL